MTKKQPEVTSKRQLRKEELRKKERQQRIITVSAIAAVVMVLVVILIVPSVQKAANPAGDFVKITPVSLPNPDGTNLGDPNAKVKIELFEDFQCSACKNYAKEIEPLVISQIIAPGLAYYQFHHFPFLDDRSADKNSDRAALASECAAEQNRFWDYKQILFANQTGLPGQFSDIRLEAFADSLKLDMNAFKSCVKTAKYQSKIDADLQLVSERGVTGTPSVFVNGIEASPGQVPTYERIMELVQQALQAN
ncbi:MAG: thioredoxin domain-containing protein [Anaerolineales bacterium]|nr:thioredoxin domain-containing protein [Anaerolineales bacterium]